MRRIIVEMVIPQLAERGGLDQFINDVAEFFLEKEDIEFRVVQLVDTGLCWWNEGFEPVSLFTENDSATFMDSAKAYGKYLGKVASAPDIILAAGWPVTVSIVRKAVKDSLTDALVVGYPHMTLKEGREKNVGSVECLSDADVVFAISKQIEDEITAFGLNKAVVRVNNGIRFPGSVENRDLTEKKRKLLYIGRLVEGKNIPMIFRAMAMAKDDWFLEIVGQGEMEVCQQQALEYGILNQVTFCGFRENPYENTEDVMFCIMPSNYEGFCLVIPEALSHGIPVISTPVGCATELIKPGENGYIVGLDDSDMLAQVLNYVSQGSLPVPDMNTCIDSVKDYELNQTLERLYVELVKLGQMK